MDSVIAIVGANLAGGRAAQALRAEGFDGEIQLIGAEPYPPYERPVLSKEALLGGYRFEDAYLQPEQEWAEQDIVLRTSTSIVHIDRACRELESSTGERIHADKVLLCTGGRLRRLSLPGADLAGVEYLRTIDDAVAIRNRLVPGAPVVVIGGGFIGAEVAACACTAGCEVTLLEVEDVPMWRVLGRELGGIVTRFHREEGVRVLTRTRAERIEGTGSVTGVVTADGHRIEAALVVVGIGLDPAVELAVSAGAAVDNGVVVNEFCETSVDGIWAAGDVANQPNSILGQRLRLEHWQNAQNQAAAAARSMLGRRTEFREVPWFWSDQYEISLQVSGHPDPRDDVVYRGDPTSRSFSAYFLRDDVLRSVVAVNRPIDVKRTSRYIASGLRVDPAVLVDESADLRTLDAVPR